MTDAAREHLVSNDSSTGHDAVESRTDQVPTGSTSRSLANPRRIRRA